MKACLPIEFPKGKESVISNSSFEVAEYYIVYDFDLDTFEIMGGSQPPGAADVTDHPVSKIMHGGAEAIITHSLRAYSFVVLKRCGIKIFKAQSPLASANVELLRRGQLRELSILDQMQGKTCGGSCTGCAKACR